MTPANRDNTVRILLVEDDEVDVMGIRRAFEKLRIANPIIEARDGVEALEILRGSEGKPPLPRPFLILLDLNMPRINGIELLRELRNDPQLHSSIVFVLTTSKSEEDMVAAYDLNVAGYMVKSKIRRDFMRLVDMLDHYWKVIEFP